MLRFDADERLIRIQLRHTDGEASLAAANLQTQLFAGEQLLPMAFKFFNIMHEDILVHNVLHSFFNPRFFS